MKTPRTVQEWIHWLEMGPGARWVRRAAVLVGGLALGSSRTPRDVMLKDAAPPGQVGKVFGFVSSGLPLGGAITPVPLGFVIDMGYPQLVLPVVAALLAASLLCAGSAQAEARSRRAAPAPAE